jgi:hypothetical protein
MTTLQTSCLTFGELADYWASDTTAAEIERIETHVFECERCARLLAETDQLRFAIGDLVRAGSVHAVVTDAVLNRLAREGVRVRSYSLGPGESLRCAVWADDDVLVTRLRGDFRGIASVDADMRLPTGEHWQRITDVPVREGATEILLALPASVVRRAPNGPIQLTLRSAVSGSPGEQVIGEYVFHHEGALDRQK